MHNFADRFSKFSGVKLARDYRSARIDLWTEKEDGERSKKNYNQCAGYIIDCFEIGGICIKRMQKFCSNIHIVCEM